MALPAHSGTRPLIQFRNHFSQTVGLLGRVISPSQGRYLNTRQHKYRINAYTHQISLHWVGVEPTIPASERAKTDHASDCAATVTGEWAILGISNKRMFFYDICNVAVSGWDSRASNIRVVSDRFGKDAEGSACGMMWLISKYFWSGWGQPRNILNKVFCLRIWIVNVLIKKQECPPLCHDTQKSKT
jgi:hypothetical protein